MLGAVKSPKVPISLGEWAQVWKEALEKGKITSQPEKRRAEGPPCKEMEEEVSSQREMWQAAEDNLDRPYKVNRKLFDMPSRQDIGRENNIATERKKSPQVSKMGWLQGYLVSMKHKIKRTLLR